MLALWAERPRELASERREPGREKRYEHEEHSIEGTYKNTASGSAMPTKRGQHLEPSGRVNNRGG